jgi:hypothetical protein
MRYCASIPKSGLRARTPSSSKQGRLAYDLAREIIRQPEPDIGVSGFLSDKGRSLSHTFCAQILRPVIELHLGFFAD